MIALLSFCLGIGEKDLRRSEVIIESTLSCIKMQMDCLDPSLSRTRSHFKCTFIRGEGTFINHLRHSLVGR